MLKKEDGKCISTNARQTTTSYWSESISKGFHTLLHTLLSTLEILITFVWGLKTRNPRNVISNKICCIKIWSSFDFKMPELLFLMCFFIVKTCPHGVFTFFLVITEESNLVVVKTYGTTNFNIFPPLQKLLVNQKCGLIALCCKSPSFSHYPLHLSLFSTYFIKILFTMHFIHGEPN
jgi:hypothetical protein